ncbi:MAG TPA: polymer-forming cytoskeletal protein [Balneolales bacterium]|nr:polymer-forming cytoskeletal protein [Balneolales bacterium]
MKKKDKNSISRKTGRVGFTVFSEGTEISGDIITEDNLRIGGYIKGNCVSSGKLIVSENAVIVGNITGVTVDVYGKVQGNVASGSGLYLSSEASLEGDCLCKTIRIDEGAFLEGNVNKAQKVDQEILRAVKEISNGKITFSVPGIQKYEEVHHTEPETEKTLENEEKDEELKKGRLW